MAHSAFCRRFGTQLRSETHTGQNILRKTLLFCGAHPTFRKGVQIRRTRRQLHWFHTGGAQDGSERGTQLSRRDHAERALTLETPARRPSVPCNLLHPLFRRMPGDRYYVARPRDVSCAPQKLSNERFAHESIRNGAHICGAQDAQSISSASRQYFIWPGATRPCRSFTLAELVTASRREPLNGLDTPNQNLRMTDGKPQECRRYGHHEPTRSRLR